LAQLVLPNSQHSEEELQTEKDKARAKLEDAVEEGDAKLQNKLENVIVGGGR
jgi:hypothetical protein